MPVLLTSCAGPADDGTSARDRASASPEPSGSATSSALAEETESAGPGAEPPARGTRIIVADSQYGPMLYDRTGQAIYLFDLEKGKPAPRCYEDCAVAWPPVLTEGPPVAVRGVRPGLLGTTQRRDGGEQVTYNGHPLYFYAHEGPYEVLCHDIDEFGGTWLVVRPDGDPAP